MNDNLVEIVVERGEVLYRGRLRPWRNDYTCVGPDGTRFQNSDKATLLSVLRRYYGKVAITVVNGPGWRDRP